MVIKNKTKIIMYMVLLMFWIYNLIYFFTISEKLDGFSFWNYVMQEKSMYLLQFVLPVIVSIITLHPFSNKISGSYLKNYLLRDRYDKFLKREIINIYLSSCLPLLIISSITFIIGCFIYGPTYSNFYYKFVMNPFLYVFITIIAYIPFTCIMANLSLILYRYLKKISITIVSSFVLFNLLNIVIFTIYDIILNVFNLKSDYTIYYAYSGGIYLMDNFIILIIVFIISSLVVYFAYKNKEKAVIEFE